MDNSLKNKIKDKKIAFFTAETIPSLAGGGRNAFYFARFFVREGARVTLCSLNYNNRLPKKEKIEGVWFLRFKYYNRSFFSKLFCLPGIVADYISLIRKNEIIILYGTYLPLSGFIILLSSIFGKKFIFRSTLLGDDDVLSIKNNSIILWPLRKFLLGKTSVYFAINNQFEETWASVFKNKIPVLCSPQGVDSYFFNSDMAHRGEKEMSEKDIVILSCGLLVERKGYRLMFQTLANIKIPFKYIVVGQFQPDVFHCSSKQELDEMKKLYQSGNDLLKEKIEFINSSDNITEYYSQADLFIHGATTEGTPNVVLEAMAVGLPVLMRELPGLSEIFIPGKTVEVFRTDNELEEKIYKLISEKEYRMLLGKNASAIIENKYTFNQIAYKLIQKLYGA